MASRTYRWTGLPVIFGVITTESIEQAIERAARRWQQGFSRPRSQRWRWLTLWRNFLHAPRRGHFQTLEG